VQVAGEKIPSAGGDEQEGKGAVRSWTPQREGRNKMGNSAKISEAGITGLRVGRRGFAQE
jgi:hypothetical protein